MDWTQSFTVIGVLGAFFIYLMTRMDTNQKQTNEKFEALSNRMTKMEADMQGMNQRITDLKTDINQRLGTIEGYLVPRKVFHFEEPSKEEPKEN